MKSKVSDLDCNESCFWSVMINCLSTWSSHGMSRYLIKHYFLVFLWRIFLERLAFKSVDWVDCPPTPCEWASFNLLMVWIEEKGRKRLNLLSFWLDGMGHQFSPAFRAPGSQIFGLRLESTPFTLWLLSLLTTPPASLGLQLADGRLWDFLASIITWTNTS